MIQGIESLAFNSLDPTIINIFSGVNICIGLAYAFFGARIHSVIHAIVSCVISWAFLIPIMLLAFNGDILVDGELDIKAPMAVAIIGGILIGVGCYFMKRVQACLLGF